jgi:DNA polymerase III sliding clamp (beta) subunit (PCNA family)
MKYLQASNDNKEYDSDDISLVCEVACNFTINSKNTEVLADIIEYVRSLPNDTNFMTELGDSFVELVYKHIENFQNED